MLQAMLPWITGMGVRESLKCVCKPWLCVVGMIIGRSGAEVLQAMLPWITGMGVHVTLQ